MNWLEALILGIIQGITEFLPVSSSGHIEIGKVILDTDIKNDITFSVVVHGATVLSTIIVFFNELKKIVRNSISFKINDSNIYILKLILSAIPVIIIGLFLQEYIEGFFTGNLLFVGLMLIITALILGISSYHSCKDKPLNFMDALIIGIAQSFAVLPGISRSGATISTGLLLGKSKHEVAQFSFLMVLLPIIGANCKTIFDHNISFDNIKTSSLIIGFFAAFISGLFACKWMIHIVKKGKLIYFSIYCFIIGTISILIGIQII